MCFGGGGGPPTPGGECQPPPPYPPPALPAAPCLGPSSRSRSRRRSSSAITRPRGPGDPFDGSILPNFVLRIPQKKPIIQRIYHQCHKGGGILYTTRVTARGGVRRLRKCRMPQGRGPPPPRWTTGGRTCSTGNAHLKAKGDPPPGEAGGGGSRLQPSSWLATSQQPFLQVLGLFSTPIDPHMLRYTTKGQLGVSARILFPRQLFGRRLSPSPRGVYKKGPGHGFVSIGGNRNDRIPGMDKVKERTGPTAARTMCEVESWRLKTDPPLHRHHVLVLSCPAKLHLWAFFSTV